MIIHTTAEGITMARKLENDSAAFYESKAKDYPQLSETLLNFAKENQKNIKNTEFTYHSAITDAIEGCFAFDLNPDDYKIKAAPSKGATYPNVLKEAMAMEEKILKFYQVAAEQSKHLMADVPRNFTLVAKKRNERIPKLKALLDQAK